MAYCNWEALERGDLSQGYPLYIDGKLEICSSEEEAEPTSFYPEDLLIMAAQEGFFKWTNLWRNFGASVIRYG